MKNVYIVGAQSTGKTTLVNALEASFNASNSAHEVRSPSPLIVREVARTVLQEKGFSREDITTSPTRALQLQRHILDAQYEAEVEASTSDVSPWYLCDRSGLDPIVYAKYFVGADAAAELLTSTSWLELEARMKEGIVFVCEAGCHWLKDDGIRLMPTDAEEWTRIDDAFRKLLDARGIPYSVISKDVMELQKRMKLVTDVIKVQGEVCG